MKVLNQVVGAIAKHRGDDTPVGLLWRASRAESNVAAWDPDIDTDVKSRHVQHALNYAEKAVDQLGGERKEEEEGGSGATAITDVDRSASHKFLAIGLGQKTQFMSNPKDQLNLASDILVHIEKALQYNANDPMLWYMRGQWKFNIAAIPYAVRYGASWVTGTLLAATFEEALSDFQEAMRVDEYFYCDNFFMAARTLLKIGKQKEESKFFLSKGIAMQDANPSTKLLQEKAKKLLEKLSL
jgi:tetratricopeptide (TPR) repeat protein